MILSIVTMSSRMILLFLLAFGMVSVDPTGLLESARAHNVSLSALAHSPPIIDGAIGTAEWAAAANQSFVMSQGKFRGTIYVMNDGANLYLAVKMQDTSLSGRFLQVTFDNNNDGTLEVGEDLFFARLAVPEFDYFISQSGPTSLSYPPDTYAGGTNDGMVGVSSDGTFSSFEFSHPLCSADTTHDFCIHAGSVVGFNLAYGDTSRTPPPANNGSWPQTAKKLLNDATGYGQLTIAG